MAKATVLESALECSRPLLFFNDGDKWPYSHGGTGFIVEYKARLFAVTAQHCIINQRYEYGQMAIQRKLDGRGCVTFLASHIPIDNSDPSKSNLADVVVYEIASNDPIRSISYKLLDSDVTPQVSKCPTIVARGFVASYQSFDYTNCTITWKPLIVQGELNEVPGNPLQSTTFPGLRDLGITSIDGMSGAPVFEVSRNNLLQIERVRLAGMLIKQVQGTVEAAYLTTKVLIAHLNGAIANE